MGQWNSPTIVFFMWNMSKCYRMTTNIQEAECNLRAKGNHGRSPEIQCRQGCELPDGRRQGDCAGFQKFIVSAASQKSSEPLKPLPWRMICGMKECILGTTWHQG